MGWLPHLNSAVVQNFPDFISHNNSSWYQGDFLLNPILMKKAFQQYIFYYHIVKCPWYFHIYNNWSRSFLRLQSYLMSHHSSICYYQDLRDLTWFSFGVAFDPPYFGSQRAWWCWVLPLPITRTRALLQSYCFFPGRVCLWPLNSNTTRSRTINGKAIFSRSSLL